MPVSLFMRIGRVRPRVRIGTEERVTDSRMHHRRAPVCSRASARACVCVWVHTYPRRTVRARSVGVDRVRLGSQAFQAASAFNAHIGSWNTASVTTLSNVCADFGRRRATLRTSRCSMRRTRMCVETCRHSIAVYVHSCLRGCACA
jgi:hypothetical protein